ncbi:hypothetical protein MF621_004022 (plasmid) [Bacillus velezensis]|uniref:hypothetical protein n=1 Tax=Bacillus velezensis TaxID=492670 RepID=UPI000A8B6A21|nr:hypothetical protein [Bacillus velezensis]URJ76316.1 hypothetical protein MF619_004060 [Bacillus velezensis]URJ80436.1 hypothetical protein MF621_004022 [Bacillus velezensis]
MKFDLKTPCKDCPFIKGSRTNISLPHERIEEIVNDIRDDKSFICHKTLELQKSDQQHCGGAMIFLEREERPNQIMRIAERIGVYDHKSLNMNADIIDN